MQFASAVDELTDRFENTGIELGEENATLHQELTRYFDPLETAFPDKGNLRFRLARILLESTSSTSLGGQVEQIVETLNSAPVVKERAQKLILAVARTIVDEEVRGL